MAADKEIALDLKINGGSTVGELKAEFKELMAVIEKTEAGTKEYAAAVSRLGAVKGDLKDLKDDIKALDPGDKAAAFAQLGSSIAGMYAGATAAAELFGAGNEDIEKSILKVQAATSIAMGVQSAFDTLRNAQVIKYITSQRLLDAQNKILTITNRVLGVSFTTVLGPISLIIAAVAAMGLVIYALRDKFEPVTKYIMGFVDTLMKSVRAVGSFLGLMDSEEEVAAEKRLSKSLERNKRNLQLMEAAGQDTYALKRKILNQELAMLEKGTKEWDEKNLELQVLDTQRRKSNWEQREKDREEMEKKAEEARKKREAERMKAEEDAYRRFRERMKGITDGYSLDSRNPLANMEALEAKKREIAKATFDHQMELRGLEISAAEEDAAREAADLEMKKRFAQEEMTVKMDTYSAVGNAAGALADLLGRHTAAGKALALAQIALDTWVGVARTLANPTVIPEPFGTIAKIASVTSIVAAGVMAAKNALAVKVPGGGGGSAPRMSGSVPAPPSIQAVTQNTASTILNPQQQNQQKVVVVESDIRKSSARVQTIEKAAKIG